MGVERQCHVLAAGDDANFARQVEQAIQEIGLRHKVEEQKALQEKVVTMTKELKEATTKAEVSKQNRFLSAIL